MEKGNAPLIFYGEYKNVRLSDDEYQKVQDKLHNHTDTIIENYQDHYVTILNWYEQDKDKLSNHVSIKTCNKRRQ